MPNESATPESPPASVGFPWTLLNGVHKLFVHNRRVDLLAQYLAEIIPANSRVLDIGAGSGELASRLLACRPDLYLEGIDILVRPDAQISVTLFDGAHIPLQDASFDYCLFVDVLHHCDNQEALMKEALRVAGKGVILKDHLCESRLDYMTLRFMDWVGNRGHGVVLPYNYLSEETWKTLFGNLALETKAWQSKLKLYPRPFSWLFGRNLHFIARMEKC